MKKILKIKKCSLGRTDPNLGINIACFSVRFYTINVYTAEPIGLKLNVEPHMTPWKVYRGSKFQKLAFNKNRFSLNFENP